MAALPPQDFSPRTISDVFFLSQQPVRIDAQDFTLYQLGFITWGVYYDFIQNGFPNQWEAYVTYYRHSNSPLSLFSDLYVPSENSVAFTKQLETIFKCQVRERSKIPYDAGRSGTLIQVKKRLTLPPSLVQS